MFCFRPGISVDALNTAIEELLYSLLIFTLRNVFMKQDAMSPVPRVFNTVK